jgi:hypothetical protein
MSNNDPQKNLNLPDDAPLDSVEQYRFEREPIKGQPELRWTGKRPFTGTQYYPAEWRETYGQPVDGWLNRIYWGDNLQVMSHLLKEFRGKVQLVYIDPPFDSKADYKKAIRLNGQDIKSDFTVFEEKQYTDIWTNDEYLQFMYERIIILRELISENGSFFLHGDPNRSHLLKLLLDEVFGLDNFINEIIWKRSGVHASTRGFGPVHDVIFFYSKKEAVLFGILNMLNTQQNMLTVGFQKLMQWVENMGL